MRPRCLSCAVLRENRTSRHAAAIRTVPKTPYPASEQGVPAAESRARSQCLTLPDHGSLAGCRLQAWHVGKPRCPVPGSADASNAHYCIAALLFGHGCRGDWLAARVAADRTVAASPRWRAEAVLIREELVCMPNSTAPVGYGAAYLTCIYRWYSRCRAWRIDGLVALDGG